MNPNAAPLLAALEKKKRQAVADFETRHAYAQKWLSERSLTLDTIREHSTRLLTGATLGSALLLASPHLPLISGNPLEAARLHNSLKDFLKVLDNFGNVHLSPASETEVEENIKRFYNVSGVFELDGNRLPFFTGLMGLEQHLYRFPGDNLGQHSALQEAGIAPGRGAFGYFARDGVSEEQMMNEERFYIVAQTFLIPEWNTDWGVLKTWYQFRKFLVINPENGKAVVAVLGDSGPGVSTGKVFGGSPEVMWSLGFYPEQTKGKTIVLFLDDPGNTIPLGPVAQTGQQYGENIL